MVASPPTTLGCARLEVFTTVIDKVYHTGKKVAEDFKATMPILFDQILPQWNYTAEPQQT
ncbi:MAG: hypothetical protein F6K19_34880 [Cyanothece sp. SIO1E1]|nr:hypothetical protein [Cyanothece sp. SIO1E1]